MVIGVSTQIIIDATETQTKFVLEFSWAPQTPPSILPYQLSLQKPSNGEFCFLQRQQQQVQSECPFEDVVCIPAYELPQMCKSNK